MALQDEVDERYKSLYNHSVHSSDSSEDNEEEAGSFSAILASRNESGKLFGAPF